MSGLDRPQPTTVAPQDGPTTTSGRIARGRARAERAARRYEELGREHPSLALPLVFIGRYTARQGMLLASAVAFRLFLWLLPLALLIAGILAGIAHGESSGLESAAKTAGVTGAASQEVIKALRDGRRSWWVAVLIGAVAFLWTTRTLIRNLAVVNAHAWQAPLPKRRQKDVLLTTLLFAVSWILLLTVSTLIGRLDHWLPGGVVGAGVVEAVVVGGAWLIICLRLPDLRTSWIDLLPGCAAFGAGYALLHFFSRVWLPGRIEQSAELYGSLGIAASMLAWLLIMGQLIVGGALINSLWAEHRAAGPNPVDGPADDSITHEG